MLQSVLVKIGYKIIFCWYNSCAQISAFQSLFKWSKFWNLMAGVMLCKKLLLNFINAYRYLQSSTLFSFAAM